MVQAIGRDASDSGWVIGSHLYAELTSGNLIITIQHKYGSCEVYKHRILTSKEIQRKKVKPEWLFFFDISMMKLGGQGEGSRRVQPELDMKAMQDQVPTKFFSQVFLSLAWSRNARDPQRDALHAGRISHGFIACRCTSSSPFRRIWPRSGQPVVNGTLILSRSMQR